jgi:hypothetical protein
MPMDTDRIFEQAVAMGRRNQETIELARRHCIHMEFREWELGGRGMAEAATGLPINARRVHCAYAAPFNSAAANLEWIASEFYKTNCVGCAYRRSTGEVPNLATFLEAREADSAEAARREHQRLRALRDAWSLRVQCRRALTAEAEPPMQAALGDLDLIDGDPTAQVNAEVTESAVRRLVALAERAPQAYSPGVVDHLSELVEQVPLLTLLSPLRLVARSLPAYRSQALMVALNTLRKGAVVEAGRCLFELSGALEGQPFDEKVVHSLVLLAGGPEMDQFGRRSVRSARNDPAGLRLVADREPDAVVGAIQRLLRRRPSSSGLLLPAGLQPDRSGDPPSDRERCAAAGAIRCLAATHAELALTLVEDLVLNVGDGDEDAYGLRAVADLQHTLAVLLTIRGADVLATLEGAGAYASTEHRGRLFGVLERARRLLDPKDRWREPGDPILGDDERTTLGGLLIEASFARVGGGWGDEVALQAASLIEELTSDEGVSMVQHAPPLLGALLVTIDRREQAPSGRVVLADGAPPQLLTLEGMSRRLTLAATAHRLTSAIKNVALGDPVGTLAVINDVLQSERANEREIELAWRVLPVLGEIGSAHGAELGVLGCVLPTLHTYLLHRDPSLRAAAIEAWTTIASRHPTPSSLSDLLPALARDQHIVVIKALLSAAAILEWPEEDHRLLLSHACLVASVIPASEGDALKRALWTARVLGASQRAAVESLILKRAGELDGYDLRDTLEGDWLPESRVSGPMARLRLRLARDPNINDRVNSRDDEELTDLLECGAGLCDLPQGDLQSAALEWCPEYPYWAAEFAEVLWRAGRVADAATVMEAFLFATPQERVYGRRRAVVGYSLAAVHLDADMLGGAEAGLAVKRAADAAADARQSCEPGDEHPTDLAEEVADRIVARCVLLGSEWPQALAATVPALGSAAAQLGRDPAAGLRDRAAQLAEVGKRLGASAQRQTATGTYVRGFAGLCEVGAHLLRFDAAELDASESREAHITAAKRRAAAKVEELGNSFGEDDPLGDPLVQALQQVAGITAGDQVEPLLVQWAALPIPLLFISGPRVREAAHHQEISSSPEKRRAAARPVVVVLAYIDNRLVTGPQVLRPGTVYTLRLDVRTGEWPEWADRLDAEIVSHLNGVEAQTPTFSWQRSGAHGGSLVGEGTLVLRFGLAAGQPAPPFLLSLRFRGRENNQLKQEVCDVAGHRELRLRPFDASRDALTTYRVVDERLLALYERLHGAGYDEEHVQAFCRLLTAMCRAGLSMTWEKRYKRGGQVRERDFHDDLHRRLLEDPELGGRVQRNEPLALGYLDIRHDGITAELKVERQVAVTEERAPKYMGQPTQYAAADGARLSILCILDMSPKATPVGTPENYLWQIRPALHGLTNPEAPSLVTVVVVNGSLPVPSSWSRSPSAGHESVK